MVRFLPILALLVASCLHTKIDVEVVVHPDGSGVRRLHVVSYDDGHETERPENIALGADGLFSVLQDDDEAWSGEASLADLDGSSSGFTVSREGLAQAGSGSCRLQSEDWFFFDRILFEEVVQDAVKRDAVLVALREAADLVVEIADATAEALFAEVYADSKLERSIRIEARAALREAAVLLWEGMLSGDQGEAVVKKLLATVRGLGVEISWDQVRLLLERNQEPQGADAVARSEDFARILARREIEMALARWVEERLVPIDPDASPAAFYNVRDLCFEGDGEDIQFAGFLEERVEEIVDAMLEDEEFEARVTSLPARIFGVFGGESDPTSDFEATVQFHLRVKMPGSLLRSTGYLEGRDLGWSFVRFNGDAAYPDGAGIECESVVWRADRYGAVRGIAIEENNETAIRLMEMLGDGPYGTPGGGLTHIMSMCGEIGHLGPLDAYIREKEESNSSSAAEARDLMRFLQ